MILQCLYISPPAMSIWQTIRYLRIERREKLEQLSKIVFSTLTLEIQINSKAPMDIITLLAVLSQCLDETGIRQLSIIVTALLTMSGRVTMLGIARWTEKGVVIVQANVFTIG